MGCKYTLGPWDTPRQILERPKDMEVKERVVCPVYQIKCGDCEASYITEMERSLKSRLMAHRRPSSTSEFS